MLLFTIGGQCLIDELATVVGIDAQDRKGEERACTLDGSQHRFLTTKQERETFRPPSGYIGEHQRVQIAPLDVGATMSNQICFQKAGSGLIPLLEGADGNLLLQQRSSSCRRDAASTQFAPRGEPPIRRCRAHGKQLFPALLCDLEVLMPFQRFKECGEKGNESFGADAVGGVPD